MAWIKTHPHLVILIAVALGILAASGMLVLNAQAFDHNFDALRQPGVAQRKVYQQDQQPLQEASANFQVPTVWKGSEINSSAFISPRYMIDKDKTIPVIVGSGAINIDSFTKQPIPDKWFLDNNLPLFTKGVSRMDPDGDGYFNEDEWRNKTDPNKADSHPPSHTKLFVVRFIPVPFLLKFQGVDGEPAKDKPETLKFQINALTLGKRTEFLGIGEMVPGTKFKITKFEYKMIKNANDVEVDVSELTLSDTEVNQPLVLVKDKITNSPDSYAEFTYLLPKPAMTIRVKKLQRFVLLPDKDQFYKLLDIDAQKATIQTPSGETLEIPKLPADYP